MTKTYQHGAVLVGFLFGACLGGRGFGTDPWWEVLLAAVVAGGGTALILHFALVVFFKKAGDDARER